MAAQAGLCLAWSETPEVTFCRVQARMYLDFVAQSVSVFSNHNHFISKFDIKCLANMKVCPYFIGNCHIDLT